MFWGLSKNVRLAGIPGKPPPGLTTLIQLPLSKYHWHVGSVDVQVLERTAWEPKVCTASVPFDVLSLMSIPLV